MLLAGSALSGLLPGLLGGTEGIADGAGATQVALFGGWLGGGSGKSEAPGF